MAKNIEFKARVTDPDALRHRVETLPITDTDVLHQRDTFFRVRSGRLKLREHRGGSSELIRYWRNDVAAARASRYSRIPIPLPRATRFVLGRLLGIAGVVSKTRQLYLIGTTRIHLDSVESLGNFVEIEVVLEEGREESDGAREAETLMVHLGIREDDILAVAYVDLLKAGPNATQFNASPEAGSK